MTAPVQPTPAATTSTEHTLTAGDAAAARIAATDQVIAERCESSGQYIAGLLAAGALEAAGTPRKLPELLFANADPAVVRAVWDAALAVGYRAGQLSVRPSWTPADLHRLRGALVDAGFRTMGRLAARSASLHPPRHPADDEVPTADQLVRDGGHP